MSNVTIRDYAAADVADVLALNEVFVDLLAPMDEEKPNRFLSAAACCRVIECGGKFAGFLMAFAPNTTYDSDNYRWFDNRYDDFLYVDRIVVPSDFQGRRLGQHFYDDLQMLARKLGYKQLVCEYYLEPLNTVSAKFHEDYGFKEIGREALYAGKLASLQSYVISGTP